MKNKLICNLIGAPGSGKTVAATSLFAALKKHHLDVTYVPEYASEKVVEGNSSALSNQLFVFSQQQYRIFCAHNHTQLVVTDSPILLAYVYNESPAIKQVILDQHFRYDNLNILMELDSDIPYSMVGRIHSYEESLVIQDQLKYLLAVHDISYVPYNAVSEDELVELIIDALQ